MTAFRGDRNAYAVVYAHRGRAGTFLDLHCGVLDANTLMQSLNELIYYFATIMGR